MLIMPQTPFIQSPDCTIEDRRLLCVGRLYGAAMSKKETYSTLSH